MNCKPWKKGVTSLKIKLYHKHGKCGRTQLLIHRQISLYEIDFPIPETEPDLQIRTKFVGLATVAKFRNTCKIVKKEDQPILSPPKTNMDIKSAAVGKAITSTNILKSRADLQVEGPLQHTITCGQVI